MAPEYLFDTSAIQNLGRRRLEVARERAHIVVSPVTLYELFSHLDDDPDEGESEEQRFARRRGLALLAEGLGVLDDPYAELGTNAGAAQFVNPTRFEEAYVVSEALRSLAASSTLDEFYRDSVKLSDGAVGTFADLGKSIERTLAQAEQEFQARVHQHDRILKRQFSFEQLRNATSEQIYSVIEQGVRRMAEGMGIAPEDAHALNRVRAACYPHLGYLVVRSLGYSVTAGPNAVPEVDRNDYEDGLISCHLTLATDRVLVSADRRFRTSVIRALAAFRDSCGVEASCRVLSLDEFGIEAGL